jgi:hypothetical protein
VVRSEKIGEKAVHKGSALRIRKASKMNWGHAPLK